MPTGVYSCSKHLRHDDNYDNSLDDADNNAIVALFVDALVDAGIAGTGLALVGSEPRKQRLYDLMARYAPAHVLAAMPISLPNVPEWFYWNCNVDCTYRSFVSSYNRRTVCLSPRLLVGRSLLTHPPSCDTERSLLATLLSEWGLQVDAPIVRSVADIVDATYDDILEALEKFCRTSISRQGAVRAGDIISALLDELVELDGGGSPNVAVSCLCSMLNFEWMSSTLLERMYTIASATSSDARSGVILPRLIPMCPADSMFDDIVFTHNLPVACMRDLLKFCDKDVMAQHYVARSVTYRCGWFDRLTDNGIELLKEVFLRSFEVDVVPSIDDLIISLEAGIAALESMPFPRDQLPSLATQLLARGPTAGHMGRRTPTIKEMERLLNLEADPQAAIPTAENRRKLRLLLDRGALSST